MSRYTAGTPVQGEYSSYTAEQLATLEKAKDPRYDRGIATTKYVNKVVLPDGTLSTDVNAIVKNVQAELQARLSADLTKPDNLRAAEQTARKVEEVIAHIDQNRFLFFVDEQGLPTVYFQCVTNTARVPVSVKKTDGTHTHEIRVGKNPDTPKLATKASKRDQAEVRERMAALIQQSHAEHAERQAARKVGVLT